MDPIGSQIAQSVAGALQASKAVLRGMRKVEDKDDASGRDEDVVDVPVTEVEPTEAPRRVSVNADEESREDREVSGYSAQGPSRKPHKGENLDLRA